MEIFVSVNKNTSVVYNRKIGFCETTYNTEKPDQVSFAKSNAVTDIVFSIMQWNQLTHASIAQHQNGKHRTVKTATTYNSNTLILEDINSHNIPHQQWESHMVNFPIPNPMHPYRWNTLSCTWRSQHQHSIWRFLIKIHALNSKQHQFSRTNKISCSYHSHQNTMHAYFRIKISRTKCHW